MNEVQTVRIQVNESQLIANLGAVFSQADKVLAELMQNARRAKAKAVHFSYHGDALVVVDDGIGIADLQNLLTVAKSGWDAETVAREHPFGMGALSALWAASIMRVESNGKILEFDTQAAIRGEELVVKDDDFAVGTRITLFGFKLDLANCRVSLEKYAAGFPIPVYFNGMELARPHAIDKLVTTKTEVGHLAAAGIEIPNGSPTATDFCLYYQGLPVNFRRFASGNVLHLDEERFAVRMPDRDTLIDVSEAEKRIYKAAFKYWRNHLDQLKAAGETEKVLSLYREIRSLDMLDLFNDIPVLPKEALSQACVDPRTFAYDTGYTFYTRHVTMEEVKSGQVVLYRGRTLSAQDLDGKAFAALKLAKDKGWVHLEQVDKEHWANQYVIDLDAVPIDVEYQVQKTEPYSLGCGCASGEIVLVNDLKITVGTHELVVNDWSCALAINPGEYDDEFRFIVPEQSSGDEIPPQVEDFVIDDRYDESAEEEEVRDFTEAVAILRGETPQVTLQRLLVDEMAAYKENCANASVAVFLKDRMTSCMDLAQLLVEFAESAKVEQASSSLEEQAKAFIEAKQPKAAHA